MTTNRYAALLDTSAIQRYDNDVAIGELLIMVAEEHRLIGVPVICAARALVENPMIEDSLALLLTQPVVDLLNVEAVDIHEVAALARQIERVGGLVDFGSVLYTSRRLGSPHIYTADPGVYEILGDGDPEIVYIGD